jgi:hypothetical protein
MIRFFAMAAINDIRMYPSPHDLQMSSPQRRRVRRDYCFFDLPVRGWQIKINLPALVVSLCCLDKLAIDK